MKSFMSSFESLLDPVVLLPLLIGALISWLLARHYLVTPIDMKLRQAKRFKKTSFGGASVPLKPDSAISPVETPFGDFRINGNGTVSDLSRKLMWIQAPWGMEWNGEWFVGDPVKISWWDATELFGKGVPLGYPVGSLSQVHLEASEFDKGYTRGKCSVAFAGFEDWRLPTAEEINRLGFFDPEGRLEGYEYSRAPKASALREKLFPTLHAGTRAHWLWCAHEQGAGMAWAVDGSWPPGDFEAKQQFNVLLVRAF